MRTIRTVHTKYYLSNRTNKGQNFFDQPVKNNLIAYDNIKEIVTGKGNDYTIVCLLHYK